MQTVFIKFNRKMYKTEFSNLVKSAEIMGSSAFAIEFLFFWMYIEHRTYEIVSNFGFSGHLAALPLHCEGVTGPVPTITGDE